MRVRFAAAFAFLALAIGAPSQAAEKPLFASADKIRIGIQAPLATVIGNRQFRGSIPGTLVEPNGQRLPITLALRGITRRTSEVCDFPPLRVEFPSPPPATSLFAGQKRLKLVTHCRDNSTYRQYVLREYAAYRMYNELTPRSFRAKLADIEYQDANGRRIASQAGYFLENLDDLAQRNGTSRIRAGDRIPLAFLSPPDAARYALFQHMIGNHDWSMRAGPTGDDCCHNAELIGVAASGQTIPVPYDFDFSGFVDASYALPPSELELSSVRDRYYRGYCVHNANAVGVAAEFRSKRPQMIAALAQVPGIDPRSVSRATAYVDRFFADIASDDAVNAKVLKRCAR